MHEWSLAKTLLQQATRISREHGGKRLLEVRINVGPLSGVDACLLESAFTQLIGEQDVSPIVLVVETQPLVVRCRDCQAESQLSDFVFCCHQCQSQAVRVVQGDQLQLVSVVADDELASPNVVRSE